MLRLAPFVALLALAFAASEKKEDATPGKYTVTEEAWFDVEVKDLDGPGQVKLHLKIQLTSYSKLKFSKYILLHSELTFA